MKKSKGIIEYQKFLEKQESTLPNGKTITLNLYHLKIKGDNRTLLYKRDHNLPQELVGKVISYLTTSGGLIFNSKIKQPKSTQNNPKKPNRFSDLEEEAIQLYMKMGYNRSISVGMMRRHQQLKK
jgi:hypothetical protein